MRNDAPIYPFRPFALFVLLFPHLIAGPIVRHNELVPQFAEDPRREGMWARISLGLVLFTIGFAKKVGGARSSSFSAAKRQASWLRRGLQAR